jgi:hypothetical protein
MESGTNVLLVVDVDDQLAIRQTPQAKQLDVSTGAD